MVSELHFLGAQPLSILTKVSFHSLIFFFLGSNNFLTLFLLWACYVDKLFAYVWDPSREEAEQTLAPEDLVWGKISEILPLVGLARDKNKGKVPVMEILNLSLEISDHPSEVEAVLENMKPSNKYYKS